MCPHCGKNAPIVNRGLQAFCTACGQPRMPLADSSVTLAGQPAKVGGTVVSVIGWIILIGGLSFALLLILLLTALWPQSILGWVIGLPVGLGSLAFALLLLFGGRKLQKTGEESAKETQSKAIMALAAHRGGLITARDAAQALDIPEKEVDTLLTEMAKQRIDEVTVEYESGEVVYAFSRFVKRTASRIQAPAVRIDTSNTPATNAEDLRALEESAAEVTPPRRMNR